MAPGDRGRLVAAKLAERQGRERNAQGNEPLPQEAQGKARLRAPGSDGAQEPGQGDEEKKPERR